jgi:hypothetical protein
MGALPRDVQAAKRVKRVWREQQRQRQMREHRESVIADEKLRLAVRERRRNEPRGKMGM